MRNMKLHEFIIQKNEIPNNVCDEIISLTKDEEWKKHEWYNNSKDINHYRTEKELDILFLKESLNEKLIPIVIKNFVEYFDIFKDNQLNIPFNKTIDNCSSIRMNRYGEGTLMLPHFDHIQSLFDGKNRGIPILSMVGILNDDYDGGEMVFFGDHEIKTKKGDLVIFPSCFLYPHEIKEIKKGTRYSFVSWAW